MSRGSGRFGGALVWEASPASSGLWLPVAMPSGRNASTRTRIIPPARYRLNAMSGSVRASGGNVAANVVPSHNRAMRARLVSHPLILSALICVGGIAAAQELAPFPSGTRSVEVLDPGTPVLSGLAEGASRRGRVTRGTHLSALDRVRSEACASGFGVRVGEEAYVCERHLAPRGRLPGGAPVPALAPGELLPHRYAFVRHDGTRTFARPSDSLVDDYVEALGQGFGLVITAATDFEGDRFLRTRRGLWVLEESMAWARGSSFSGRDIRPGEELDLAWVRHRGAAVRARPGGRVLRRLGRRAVVRVAGRPDGRFVELEGGGFVRSRDLAQARLADPPEGLGPEERWLDISVSEQVLVAYEGARPTFATLVSTGRARRGSETPIGAFRIWVKLAFSDMSNLRYEDVSSHYAMEQVPWVQYFEGSNGLHAAFWHDDFGRRRSHGCINLSPQDARWVFGFTGPALPNGWDAIFPHEGEPGTVVRVRP